MPIENFLREVPLVPQASEPCAISPSMSLATTGRRREWGICADIRDRPRGSCSDPVSPKLRGSSVSSFNLFG